jgi:hypothetical protein
MAEFKFNKPGRYTLQCRLVGQDKCLGQSRMSQLVTVWVALLDMDADLNHDGVISDEDEELEGTARIWAPEYGPEDSASNSQRAEVTDGGPPDAPPGGGVSALPKLIIRKIGPPGIPRCVIKLEKTGGTGFVCLFKENGDVVLSPTKTLSDDLWPDIVGNDACFRLGMTGDGTARTTLKCLPWSPPVPVSTATK